MAELTLLATLEKLDDVLAFLNENLEEHHCSVKVRVQIAIAVEEIYVNIAHYAYDQEIGTATIRVEVGGEPLQVSITFMDNGVPYDPLQKADPDTKATLQDRAVGGLGIFMVKKSMDDIYYTYENGKNILTLKKKL
ncbi:MAG: ATP-binding protein [Ruthenibacterium sp.]